MELRRLLLQLLLTLGSTMGHLVEFETCVVLP
jgi:hypothetical protein